MKKHTHVSKLTVFLGLCAVAVMCVGCPGLWGSDDGTTKLTTIFSADQDPLKAAMVAALLQKAEVPVEDIASLVVTVSQISLVPAGDDEEEGEEEETPEEKQNASHVFLFDEGDEPIEVDVLNLMSVSEVLSAAEIPSGTYNQIRLEISDPKLTLVGSEEVVEDVHLTANSRLFVTQEFEIEGENVLLELSFDGLHLVQEGNGTFNLTPQLQATLDITSADVYLEGVILEIDTVEAGVLTVQLANGDEVPVAYTGATVWLPGDPDPIAGTTADLAAGQEVQVTGTIWLDGSISATEIVVLPEPEPVEEPPAE